MEEWHTGVALADTGRVPRCARARTPIAENALVCRSNRGVAGKERPWLESCYFF